MFEISPIFLTSKWRNVPLSGVSMSKMFEATSFDMYIKVLVSNDLHSTLAL